MSAPAFLIKPVRATDDLKAAIILIEAYVASLGIDLAYQGFDAEMAAMPGKYAPPKGELLLARDGEGRALGCVCLRPLSDGVCEMKRLYVAPEGRGLGLGRALADAIVTEARRIGYSQMLLDTLPSRAPAIALYRTMGFEEIPAYYSTPVPDTLFFRLKL